MNQYTVLLVDDEEEVFQVIMKKTRLGEHGIFHCRLCQKWCGGFGNGGGTAAGCGHDRYQDAIYGRTYTLQKAQRTLPESESDHFSGFDEFEYAKEAIKIEAEEYILKPINSNELREVFERIKTNLDKEMDEKSNIEKLRAYYMESLPVLQENFYTSLIEGRIPESQIEKYVQNYQINLTGPYYVVTVLHISTTNPENA